MSAVDVCKKGGLTGHASFAATVSSAIKLMFAAYREMGLIPTRDGFEWPEIMSRFGDVAGVAAGSKELVDDRLAKHVQGKKLTLTEEFEALSAARNAIGADNPMWPITKENRYQELLNMEKPS
jgi:hypothetical protein